MQPQAHFVARPRILRERSIGFNLCISILPIRIQAWTTGLHYSSSDTSSRRHHLLGCQHEPAAVERATIQVPGRARDTLRAHHDGTPAHLQPVDDDSRKQERHLEQRDNFIVVCRRRERRDAHTTELLLSSAAPLVPNWDNERARLGRLRVLRFALIPVVIPMRPAQGASTDFTRRHVGKQWL